MASGPLLQPLWSPIPQDSCAWRPAAGWLSSSLTTVPLLHPGRTPGLGLPQLHRGHVYSPQLPAPGSPEDTSPPPLFPEGCSLVTDRLSPWLLPLLSLESLGLGKYWCVCLQSRPPQLPAGSEGWGLSWAVNFIFKYLGCSFLFVLLATELGVCAAFVLVGWQEGWRSSLGGTAPREGWPQLQRHRWLRGAEVPGQGISSVLCLLSGKPCFPPASCLSRLGTVPHSSPSIEQYGWGWLLSTGTGAQEVLARPS